MRRCLHTTVTEFRAEFKLLNYLLQKTFKVKNMVNKLCLTNKEDFNNHFTLSESLAPDS